MASAAAGAPFHKKALSCLNAEPAGQCSETGVAQGGLILHVENGHEPVARSPISTEGKRTDRTIVSPTASQECTTCGPKTT